MNNKYLDLNKLEVITITNEVINFLSENVNLNETDSLIECAGKIGSSIEKMVARIDTENDSIYHFNLYVNFAAPISGEFFESIINLSVSNLCANLLVNNKGRSRERRLDVPDNLKLQLNCNMTPIKRMINYQTKTNKIMFTISAGELNYIMVGDLDE